MVFCFHLYRCHTFGIGSEACHELVLGVAALSNGRHVLIGNKDRLQEKVRLLYSVALNVTAHLRVVIVCGPYNGD